MFETKKFNFGREFQVRALALMRRKFDFLTAAVSIVKPEYFEDKALSWAFTTIVAHYQDYALCAELRVMENELQKAVTAGRVRKEDEDACATLIAEVEAEDVALGDAYTVDQVVRFCRRQEVRRALLEVAPKTESEDQDVWEEIEQRISTACNTGANSINIGTSYFAEYAQRCQNRFLDEAQRCIPTGIDELDKYIGGGLRAGQLGVWLGGTGTGKSVALPHCGKFAVMHKLKVVHYTLELNEIEVSTRYDAAWTGTPLYDLKDQSRAVEKKLHGLLAKYGEALLIKGYPTNTATIETLKTHLVALRSNTGFIPDLVVVDYGDLIKATSNYNDEYADLGTIFKDLRGLAETLNIPIWTATQANRTSTDQEVVGIEQMGDSFKKAQIADIVIAIGGTREDKADNIITLNIAKNRNGPTGKNIAIRTAYDRMCFFDPFNPPPADRKRKPVLPDGQFNSQAPALPRPPRRAPRQEA